MKTFFLIISFCLIANALEIVPTDAPNESARASETKTDQTQVAGVSKNFVSINIVFEDELEGIKHDLSAFKKWSELIGKKSEYFQDRDISKGKEQILAQIKTLAQRSDIINFNYSGHGMRIETVPGVYGENKTNDGLPCKPDVMSSVTCSPDVIKPPQYEYYLVSDATISCQKKCIAENPSTSFTSCKATARKMAIDENPFFRCKFETEDCVAQLRKGDENGLARCASQGRSCAEDQSKITPLQNYSQTEFMLSLIRSNKILGNCSEAENNRVVKLACFNPCLANFSISAKDLESTLEGKKVFGVIDACHSGGFVKNLKLDQKMLMASSREDEVSADLKDSGGRLVSYYSQLLNGGNCDSKGNPRDITLNTLFKRQVVYELKNGRVQDAVSSISGNGLDQLIFADSSKLKCAPMAQNTGSGLSSPGGGDHDSRR